MRDPSKISFVAFVDSCNVLDGRGWTTPKIHRDIAEWLENTDEDQIRLLMAFRHSGKTDLIRRYVVWRLLRDPNFEVLIVSAAGKGPVKIAKSIRDLIHKHPFTQHLINSADKAQSKFTVTRTSSSLNPSVAVTSITAKATTGQHADMVIADDVEVPNNVRSEESRLFLRDRIAEFGQLATRQLFIGTPHHKETIYRVIEDWGIETKKIPLLNDKGEVAWPDNPELVKLGKGRDAPVVRKFSAAWCEWERQRYGEYVWRSQYLLIPESPDDTELPVDNIKHYDAALEYKAKYDYVDKKQDHFYWLQLPNEQEPRRITSISAYWDPAIGRQGRDRSVLAVALKDDQDREYLHRIVELPEANKDTGYFNACKRIFEVCEECHVPQLTIESNGIAMLEAEMRRAGNELKKSLPVRSEPRKENKEEFIANRLEPLLRTGRLWISKQAENESHFMGEARDFPNSKKDDCIDSAAGALDRLPHSSVATSPDAKRIESHIHREPARSAWKSNPLGTAGRRLVVRSTGTWANR